MPIIIQNSKTKLMCGGSKIAKMYCEGDVIYSSGNICTYMVDGAIYKTVELDEGDNVLNAVPNPSKSTYTFKGWSLTNGGSILSSLSMGDNPITLYAVWQYVGAPFYIVKDRYCQQTLGWTKVSTTNAKGAEAINFTAGSRYPTLSAQNIEDDNEPNSFTMRSNSIATKGNKTIRIQASATSGGGKITINNVTKSFSSGTLTFDISNTSSIQITATANIYGKSGPANMSFIEIYLY